MPAREVSPKELNISHSAIRVPVGGEGFDHCLLIKNGDGPDHVLCWSALSRVEAVEDPVEGRVILLWNPGLQVVNVAYRFLDLLELVEAYLSLEAPDENLHAFFFRKRVLPVLLHGAPHLSLVEVGLLEPTWTGYSPLCEEVRCMLPHTIKPITVGLPGLGALHRVVAHEELCLESQSFRAFCLVEERLRPGLPRTNDNELHLTKTLSLRGIAHLNLNS